MASWRFGEKTYTSAAINGTSGRQDREAKEPRLFGFSPRKASECRCHVDVMGPRFKHESDIDRSKLEQSCAEC